jgi:hypothetical protein
MKKGKRLLKISRIEHQTNMSFVHVTLSIIKILEKGVFVARGLGQGLGYLVPVIPRGMAGCRPRRHVPVRLAWTAVLGPKRNVCA